MSVPDFSRLKHDRYCSRPENVKAVTGRLGDPILMCNTCGAWLVIRDESSPPVAAVEATPASGSRLECVRCYRSFPVSSSRAVTPLCEKCKTKAEDAKTERARKGREGRRRGSRR